MDAARLDSLTAAVMVSVEVKDFLPGCSDFIQGANKEQRHLSSGY